MTPDEVAAIVKAEMGKPAEPVVSDKKGFMHYASMLKAGAIALFSPIQSLFTARTIWVLALLYVIAKTIGKGDASAGLVDLRAFAISVMWAVVGIAAAVYGRKFLIPDVKLSEWYANILGARDLAEAVRAIACAIVIAAVHLVQVACIFVIAVGALKSGV